MSNVTKFEKKGDKSWRLMMCLQHVEIKRQLETYQIMELVAVKLEAATGCCENVES